MMKESNSGMQMAIREWEQISLKDVELKLTTMGKKSSSPFNG